MNELYDITDEIIETKIGKLHFTKVKDRKKLFFYNQVLIIQKQDLINYLKNKNKIVYKSICDNSLFEFLQLIRDIKFTQYGLYNLYLEFKSLFLFCFNEDVFDLIETNEEFEFYRDLIIEVNCIPYEKPNPNPEIEWFNQLERKIKEETGESISFDSLYTSVWIGSGCCPDDMTLYKFHKLFYRIAQFKNWNMTTLFKTVDCKGTVKIESWAKNEEIKEDKKTSLNKLMSAQRKL